MLHPKSIMHHIRRLLQDAQRPSRCQPRGPCFWKGAWPHDVLHTPCQTEVITWNCYLTEDIRDALLDIYAGDRTDEQFAAAAKWLDSRSFRDRVRIAHFDWTYTSYIVPDWPTYCVWLTRDEIRTRVFPSPVPPFTAIAYDRLKQMPRRDGVHDSEQPVFSLRRTQCSKPVSSYGNRSTSPLCNSTKRSRTTSRNDNAATAGCRRPELPKWPFDRNDHDSNGSL